MSENKYTKDGKKVAVIGKLNNEEWIVQEIFVADGKEFPAGENFTTKTLLDKPAETYYDRRQKEFKQRIERIEGEIKTAEKKCRIVERKATASRLINYATEKYADIDLEQLDALFAFMAGQITHVVVENYSDYIIESLIDAVEATDTSYYGRASADGLRLVSLFGCRESGERDKNDRSFRIDWKINQYRDGSGSRHTIYPCKSYDEAVAKLDELISQKENATESQIAAKEKYGLANPTKEKITAYRQMVIENKKQSVDHAEKAAKKARAELEEAETHCQEKNSNGGKNVMSKGKK